MLKVLSRRTDHIAWPPILGMAASAVLLFFLFFWRLGGLTGGLSAGEVSARSSSLSIHAIIHDPVNAPHKLLQLAFERLLPHQAFWLRFPSVIFALLFLFCFYKLTISWFGRSIGLFGSVVFAALPLFVISSRQASAQIMYFAPIALIWLYTWLTKKDSPKSWAWLLLILAAALLIYTPGIAIWVLAAFIIARKKIITAISGVPPLVSAFSLLVLAAAAGSLTVSGAHNHAVAKQLVLWPSQFAAIGTILKNIGWMTLSFVWRTGAHSNLIIGRLPLLDVITLAMLIFGVYAMLTATRAKTVIFALMIVYAIAAAGVNNDLAMLALCLPAIGVFIAAGMRYLYIEWRSIFPRNPVPKTFALTLIAAVTLSQLYFGLRYSLVAWPHSPAASSAYVLK